MRFEAGLRDALLSHAGPGVSLDMSTARSPQAELAKATAATLPGQPPKVRAAF